MFSDKKVLLVDDEPEILEVTSFTLENFSIDQITNCLNGLEALTKSNEQHFDLIITDYFMPKMNGIDFIQKVRSNPDHLNYNTPIILLTAFQPDLMSDSSTWKNVYFLEKPISDERFSYYIKCALQ